MKKYLSLILPSTLILLTGCDKNFQFPQIKFPKVQTAGNSTSANSKPETKPETKPAVKPETKTETKTEQLTPEQEAISKKQIVRHFEISPPKSEELKEKTAPLSVQAIELVKQDKVKVPSGSKMLRLYVTIPRDPSRTLEDRGFSVQALPVNSIVKVQASLNGLGISVPIQPQGIDANGYLPVPPGGLVTVDFIAPVGVKRVVTLEGYTSLDRLVQGSTLKGVLDIEETQVSNTNIHFMTTPTGLVVEQLLANNPLMASLINVPALQSFIDTQLTQPSSSTPPIQFQRHPSLVKASEIYNEIQTLNANTPPGEPVILPTAPTAVMTINPLTLTGTIMTGSGYNNINITLNSFDPASPTPGFSFSRVYAPGDLGPKNIPFSIAGLAPNNPGEPWTVKLSGTLTGNKFFSGEITQMVDLSQTTTLNFFIF